MQASEPRRLAVRLRAAFNVLHAAALDGSVDTDAFLGLVLHELQEIARLGVDRDALGPIHAPLPVDWD
jgi:hypothetical protein